MAVPSGRRNVTPKQLDRIINRLLPCLIEQRNKYEVPSLSSVQGLITFRVHDEQKDTSGGVRKYKDYPSYYTEKAGKVNENVNMKLAPAAGLQDDFKVYREALTGNNCLGVSKEISRIKLSAEEKRRGSSLYIPNKEEKEKMFEVYFDRLTKEAVKCIKIL